MAEDQGSEPTGLEDRHFGAERAKAFIDAVVAIAITLLILPLMESLSDFASTEQPASSWFSEHLQQLVSFVISFWVIATFWIMHHQIYRRVDNLSLRLLWILVIWLMTIVWLPVATAMSGQLNSDDLVVRTVYIGSIAMTGLLGVRQLEYLRKHPDLHSIPERSMMGYLAIGRAMIALYAVVLAVMLLIPASGYLPLFLLALTGLVSRLFLRRERSQG